MSSFSGVFSSTDLKTEDYILIDGSPFQKMIFLKHISDARIAGRRSGMPFIRIVPSSALEQCRRSDSKEWIFHSRTDRQPPEILRASDQMIRWESAGVSPADGMIRERNISDFQKGFHKHTSENLYFKICEKHFMCYDMMTGLVTVRVLNSYDLQISLKRR